MIFIILQFNNKPIGAAESIEKEDSLTLKLTRLVLDPLEIFETLDELPPNYIDKISEVIRPIDIIIVEGESQFIYSDCYLDEVNNPKEDSGYIVADGATVKLVFEE